MHERTAEVVRWQPASSSISHVFGRICRSWITLTFIPPPSLFHRRHNVSSLHTLCLSLDTRRVRIRMFGYAKCSRASQVECLMALFCLNTDLDTTAERRLRICIHSPAAPTCLLLGYAELPLRVSRWITSKNSVPGFTRIRDAIRLFKDPVGMSRLKFTRDGVLCDYIVWIEWIVLKRYESNRESI